MCLFVSVDREGQFAKQAFTHVYRALKLIYSEETPKIMQRDTVSLETQVGHHCSRLFFAGGIGDMQRLQV